MVPWFLWCPAGLRSGASDIQEVVFEVSRSNCPMGTSRGSDVRESYFFIVVRECARISVEVCGPNNVYMNYSLQLSVV